MIIKLWKRQLEQTRSEWVYIPKIKESQFAIVICGYFPFSCRVVQKNLVFVVGLTQRLADPEVCFKVDVLMCYRFKFKN